MRNKNTLGKLEYVWDSVYWSALVFLLYRSTIFCPVFTLDYTLSTIILASTIIVGAIAGILLTYKRRRNYASIFCNLALSVAPYYIVSFWNITQKIFLISGCIAIIALILYCGIVLFSYIGSKKDSSVKASGFQWINSCFLSCRTLVSIVLAFLLLGTGIKPMLGLPIMEFKTESSVFETPATDEEGETITKNMGTVLLLQEDEWSKLNTEERLRVMKTIADIESNYLGIQKLTVCTEPLDENTLGHYNDATKTITLNLSYLSTADAKTMLSTLCHECYHSYQHRLVELYDQMEGEAKGLLLFRDASYYKDEFANYVDGSEDYESYSTQWCELDSDKYADEAIIDYYYRIYQYNEQKNGGNEE